MSEQTSVGKRRFVLLTNIPAPYRVAFFNSLASALAKQGVDFEVWFCAESEPNRKWKIDRSTFCFNYSVLPGWHPSIHGLYAHFNWSIIAKLRRARPAVMLMAGSWNTPTVF